MNFFKTLENKAPPLIVLGALPAGVGLFFLVRLLEGTFQGSMTINVLFEEAAKFALFVLVALAARAGRAAASRKVLLHEKVTLLLFALLCVVVFGITENILYFVSFPTSSIYKRLLYSYPIHLNTALLYALGFLSGRASSFVLYFIICSLYHLGLNHLSLRLPVAGVYAFGIANLVFLLLLYWRVRVKLIERSIQECWNPK